MIVGRFAEAFRSDGIDVRIDVEFLDTALSDEAAVRAEQLADDIAEDRLHVTVQGQTSSAVAVYPTRG